MSNFVTFALKQFGLGLEWFGAFSIGLFLTGFWGIVLRCVVPFFPETYIPLTVYFLMMVPALVIGALCRFCITMQRDAALREWDSLSLPWKAFVWTCNHVSIWPTAGWYLVMDALGQRKYCDLIDLSSKGLEKSPKIFLTGLPTSALIKKLHAQHGLKAVVNCCVESAGPAAVYEELGIQVCSLEAMDYCNLSRLQVAKGALFMKKHIDQGNPVLVHCKAGKGRSTTVVVAYLGKYIFGKDAFAANQIVRKSRPSALWIHKRAAVQGFIEMSEDQVQVVQEMLD
uniref:Uncharacterized protein n=1 Tax=Chromera velia CCMP2878 TaxID=1169474 RepID=A0A0G4FNM0_9ALVE|eukprot:Cvel_17890.t1-p1 / transcript=Cvel_17890.t1 / gene=Cvel_17890 / organism=Chromera_velia_CCMP2878 / gene_product=hypothetical protein / transcript_product=hypothetical protein / location=Cvel_scaffold1452:7321-8169(+) / protein_length=283 / sequence_SO=supercontig / SO=protein_coding / is_pseudo=false